MKIGKLFLFAEILVLIVLFFLVIKSYTVWVWALLIFLVILLISLRLYINLRSTIYEVRPSLFHTKELNIRVDFLDDKGEKVHVIKEQVTKPYKSKAFEYSDRGLAGTGLVTNFKSFLYIDDQWKEIDISSPKSRKVEGAELVVITRFDPPLTDNEWTKRRFEFECINCFKEKEESFVFRVDTPIELFTISFFFDKNHKPDRIDVLKIMGDYETKLTQIMPSSIKPEEFDWSIKNPPFGASYLFTWKW